MGVKGTVTAGVFTDATFHATKYSAMTGMLPEVVPRGTAP